MNTPVVDPVAAPVVDPVVSSVALPVVEVPASVGCTTSAHLMAYPLVKETVEYVQRLPGVEAINEVSKPVAELVQNQRLLKPVLESVDKVGDYTLDLSESVVPCIKTVDYQGITNSVEAPFIAASDAIQKSTQWTTTAIQDNVYSPTRQMVKDFRSYYNKHLYDTKGKPLIRSCFDPLVRPLNNYAESLGNAWLPESEPLTDNYSSEIEKSCLLSYDLTKRSIPAVLSLKMEVIMSPYNYTVHAIDVFNKNLSKESSNLFVSPLHATYNSTIDLASEAWSTTLKVVGLGKTNTESTITDIAATTTVTNSTAEAIVPEISE